MDKIKVVKTLWHLFSRADYRSCESILHENLKVVWPTSRELYDSREKFIVVNEAFGGWVILHGLSIPSQNISKCLPHTLNSLFKVNCLYG